jgi:hypothetical protein
VEDIEIDTSKVIPKYIELTKTDDKNKQNLKLK